MKNNKIQIILLVVFMLVTIVSTVFCSYWIIKTENLLEQKSIEQEEHYNQMIEHMEAFDARQSIEREKLKKMQDKLRNISSFMGPTNRNEIKELDFSIYSDLKDEAPCITIQDMNRLIDKWGANGFKNYGQVFIRAGQETGLNPIYLFAHAAVESGWGTSYLAQTRGNYFGIGAYTNNPNCAYEMGESIEDGIINGAIWINENYYLQGAQTLAQMKARGYASNPNWEHDIAYIVMQSYIILGGLI